MDEQAWREKSLEILTDVKERRRVHPRATYVEIEKEVHRRMMELEAQILQDLAQASPSREWGKLSGQPAMLCPTCAVPLQARGKQKRTLQGNGGQQVTIKRTYGTCPQCGAGFFPLDEELAFLPGTLAPRQQEHLVHLASWMPFDKAAQMIEELLWVQTSQETVRCLTERTGACMEASRATEAPCPHESNDQQPKSRCVFSADGAMVSLVQKQWVETRTVVIGEPEEKRNAEGQREIHVGSLSYFSRLADASTFTRLAEVEIERRKVKQAVEVCAVMDGADWLQDLPTHIDLT